MHTVNRHYLQLTAPGVLNISYSKQMYSMKLTYRKKPKRRDSMKEKKFLNYALSTFYNRSSS